MYGYIVPVLVGVIFVSVVSQREGWQFVTPSSHPQREEHVSHFATGTILFAPDIMLGRSVEDHLETHGRDYPFRSLRDFISRHTLAIANFEAAVPEYHVKTEPFTFRFSVREEYLHTLPTAGFDVLSLANNHALDFGNDGYTNTRRACERAHITCVGHPTRLDSDSYTLQHVGSTTVGILMLHTLFTPIDTDDLNRLLAELRMNSDVQFAFVHWGEEYVYGYTASQERLAHTLIDGGVDAVVGHHPHVIAPVSFYKGKPIFYSLGNLVFDQYWNKEVQTGFLVSGEVGSTSITYTIHPYESYTHRLQPHIMSEQERAQFIDALLSSYSLKRVVGGFTIDRD